MHLFGLFNHSFLAVPKVSPQKEKQTNKQQNVPTALSNYSNSIPTAYFLLFVRFILFKANDNFPFEYKITQSLK